MSDTGDEVSEALGLLQAGRAAEARSLLDTLCTRHPDSARAWFARGAAHHLLGRLPEALEDFERSVRLDAGQAQSQNARAAVLSLLGRDAEALQGWLAAHRLAPEDPDILVNLGLALESLGRIDEAQARYDAALALDPDCRRALLSRTALRLAAGRPAEALADADRLAALEPDATGPQFNRCEALLALDRYEDTLVAARRVLALAPGHVGALIDRAVALACLGQIGESRAAFELARRSDPHAYGALAQRIAAAAGSRPQWLFDAKGMPDPRAICLARGTVRLSRCDWRDRDAFLRRFPEIVRAAQAAQDPVCEFSLPFAALALPVARAALDGVVHAVAQRIDRDIRARRPPPVRARAPDGRRLRIGYLTPDVTEHPTAFLVAPVLRAHDRTAVETILYALNPHDPGPIAGRLRESVERVHECAAMSDEAVARLIRDDGVDVLVDLSGQTEGARPEILALRPAPVAASYLGNMATCGSDWVDYRLLDAISTPPGCGEWWTEQPVYLPRTMYAYDPDEPVATAGVDRAWAGLPGDAFVFCAFNNAYKIEPVLFDVWMRLLARVPRSVLWLSVAETARARLVEEAADRGIDPERLVFASRVSHDRHLARMALADLFLDTLHYNAMTTGVEAVFAGLPLLTVAGTTTTARCGASIALAAGVPKMVVPTVEAYEARALALATDPAELAAVRGAIARGRATCPLWQPGRLARAFERAYAAMVGRAAAGLPPGPLDLGG